MPEPRLLLTHVFTDRRLEGDEEPKPHQPVVDGQALEGSLPRPQSEAVRKDGKAQDHGGGDDREELSNAHLGRDIGRSCHGRRRAHHLPVHRGVGRHTVEHEQEEGVTSLVPACAILLLKYFRMSRCDPIMRGSSTTVQCIAADMPPTSNITPCPCPISERSWSLGTRTAWARVGRLLMGSGAPGPPLLGRRAKLVSEQGMMAQDSDQGRALPPAHPATGARD